MPSLKNTLLMGGLLGATAVGLTATRPGKKIQKKIHSMAQDLVKQIHTQVKNIKNYTEERYNDTVNAIVDVYVAKKNLAQDMVGLLREDMRRLMRKESMLINKKVKSA
jgi:gas vesicle protein